MKLSAILKPLLDAKADHETIRDMILAFEGEQSDALARRRASDAKRQAEKRERDKNHVTSRDVTVTVSSRASDARVEDNLQTKNQAGQETRKQEGAPAAPTPRSELLSVLDEERAVAVVEHRIKLRKPLTAHAAHLLALKFAKVSDPNAAADAMVENGWQGFEPSWLEDRGKPRAKATAPPGPPRTVSESAIYQLQTGRPYEPPSHSNGSLDPGDPRGQATSPRGAELIAFAAKSFGRIE